MLVEFFRRNKRGFTLIELLVVVFIIGIASAAIVYRSGGGNDARQTQAFARHFKAQIQIVREESLLQMKIFGLMIKDQQYQFCQYTQKPKQWSNVQVKDSFWREYKIPSNIKLTYSVEKSKVHLESTATVCQPQIVFFPSGDITGFILTISNKKLAHDFKIVGNSDGSISMEE